MVLLKSTQGENDSQYDYLGFEIESDEFIVYNFIRIWEYLEEIFDNLNISYEMEEFDLLKEQIYHESMETKKKFWSAVGVYTRHNEIVERAAQYSENDFMNYEEVIQVLDTLSLVDNLYEDSRGIDINTIKEFKEWIIHVYFNEDYVNNRFYFSYKIPRFETSIPLDSYFVGFFDDIGLEKLAWIAFLFEQSLKHHIYTYRFLTGKEGSKYPNLSKIIGSLETNITKVVETSGKLPPVFEVSPLAIQSYDLHENIFILEFIEKYIKKCCRIRNELVHEPQVIKYKLKDIIKPFEIFFLNLDRFCQCSDAFFHDP